MPNHQEHQRRHMGPVGWFRSKISLQGAASTIEVDECLACAEEFPLKRLVTLTCPEGHKYCQGCFEKLVKSGCQNELAFPPRCCQINIPRDLIRAYASRTARKNFDILTEITKISPDNRWYCPHSKCYKAIDVETAKVTDKGLKCPHCNRNICILCKQAAHSKDSQCSNGALKETLRTSQQNGWRSCFKCGEMVELREGCRHITCRCKAEFCYICGEKWGKCVSGHKCVQKLEEIRAEESRRRGAWAQDEEDEEEDEVWYERRDRMRLRRFELDVDSDGESVQIEPEDSDDEWDTDDNAEHDEDAGAENEALDRQLTEAIEQSALEYYQLKQRERELTRREEREISEAIRTSINQFREEQRLMRAAQRAWAG